MEWIVLQDFHEEYAKVAFKLCDPDGTGFISAVDFNDILRNIKSHLLTPDVRANLIAVSRTFHHSSISWMLHSNSTCLKKRYKRTSYIYHIYYIFVVDRLLEVDRAPAPKFPTLISWPLFHC